MGSRRQRAAARRAARDPGSATRRAACGCRDAAAKRIPASPAPARRCAPRYITSATREQNQRITPRSWLTNHEGEPAPLLQLLQQQQHLRLHGHIECGDRFVGNDQLRSQRECTRDADALLSLTAGKIRADSGRARSPACRPPPAARPRVSRAARPRAMPCTASGYGQGAADAAARNSATSTDPGTRSACAGATCSARHRSRPRTSVSANRMVSPRRARSVAAIARAAVDLPQPDSPTRPNALAGIDREADAVDRAHRCGGRDAEIPFRTMKCLTNPPTSRTEVMRSIRPRTRRRPPARSPSRARPCWCATRHWAACDWAGSP